MKVFGLSIKKTDTQETADASIASEDAVLQAASSDDSSESNHTENNDSKHSRRSIDFSKLRLHDGSGDQFRTREDWYRTVDELCLVLREKLDIRYFICAGALVLLLCGIAIVANDSKEKKELTTPPGDTIEPDDPFDFSDFITDAPTASVTTRDPTADFEFGFELDRISAVPSSMPVYDPVVSTNSPTKLPTPQPTTTNPPSTVPTSIPTYLPTKLSQLTPFDMPPIKPFTEDDRDAILTFCVIADVPYSTKELEELPGQIATQMEGCEFLVHLGDIFVGDTFCDMEDYQTIQRIMLQSQAPSFLVPGDNEWNDCYRGYIDVGWDHWTNHFVGFENNWNHTFSVIRQPNYPENFYFIKKRTLVFGLNIVGGRVHNETEWETRLRSEYSWVRSTMLRHLVDTEMADGVILMAHAHPSEDHSDFFNRFRVFLRDELANEFPVLYLHGDGHNFIYTPNYHHQPNFLRIQHEGGTNEPVLKIMSGPGRGPGGRSSAYDAFQYDRQLEMYGSREKDRKKREMDEKGI